MADFVDVLWASLAMLVIGPGLEFVDVGQGAALIAIGSEADVVLVDSGPAGSAEAIVAALGTHGVEHVDLAVHTHFDADHVGGLARVLAGPDNVFGSQDDVTVGLAWDRGTDRLPHTDAVGSYLAVTNGVRVEVGSGARWQAPGLGVEVIHAGGREASTENARGIALCVDVGRLRVLAAGDLPAMDLESVASRCPGVDVLWASHHGGEDGTSIALLERVAPEVVVITAGMSNPYCHPARQTLARLRDHVVWITGVAGLGPGSACPALRGSMAAGHHVAASNLWIPAD